MDLQLLHAELINYVRLDFHKALTSSTSHNFQHMTGLSADKSYLQRNKQIHLGHETRQTICYLSYKLTKQFKYYFPHQHYLASRITQHVDQLTIVNSSNTNYSSLLDRLLSQIIQIFLQILHIPCNG